MTTNPRPEGRRPQCGLRKLLLWTAVVVVYVAFWRITRANWIGLFFVAPWIATLGVCRILLGLWAAVLLWVLTGVLINVWGIGDDGVVKSQVVSMAIQIWEHGTWHYVFLELSFHAVNWADDRMRTKTDG